MASPPNQIRLALVVNGKDKAPIYPGGSDRGLKRVALFSGQGAALQRR